MRSFCFYSTQLLLWLFLLGLVSRFHDYHCHGWVGYNDTTKTMVLIFLWYCSALHLSDLHRHGWVRFIDTTKITVLRFLWDCSVFVLNTVIIVTYFVRGQHFVLVIAIVTGECAILILQKLRFVAFHCCYCLLIYDDYVILLCFILNLPMVQWWNGGWWNGVMVK